MPLPQGLCSGCSYTHTPENDLPKISSQQLCSSLSGKASPRPPVSNSASSPSSNCALLHFNFSGPQFFLYCMCVMCSWGCMLRRSGMDARCPPQLLLPLSLRQGLTLNLELTDWVGQPGSEVQGPPVFASPVLGSQTSGFLFRSSWLYSKHFLPSPRVPCSVLTAS